MGTNTGATDVQTAHVPEHPGDAAGANVGHNSGGETHSQGSVPAGSQQSSRGNHGRPAPLPRIPAKNKGGF